MPNRPPIAPEDPRGSAQTPVAFVLAILAAYRRYGADPAKALAHARIPRTVLAQPDGRISAGQIERLTGYAMHELDDEALGWFSRRLPWGSYGMLCRASLGAPNLGVALKRWCRHHRLLTEDVLLEFEVRGGLARVAIREQRALGELREFCLFSLLRFLLGYACWVVDARLPLQGASFPGPAPAHAGLYPLLFEGPVRFGAAQAELCFDGAYLGLALRRDEAALRAMLQRALPLPVLQYPRDRRLLEQVRQLLDGEAGLDAGAERLAQRLNLSVRSLHRHLAREGSTLQALKDQARRACAEGLLARSRRPVKQVAAAAGFRDGKAFARAFRVWTGETPSAYRARHWTAAADPAARARVPQARSP